MQKDAPWLTSALYQAERGTTEGIGLCKNTGVCEGFQLFETAASFVTKSCWSAYRGSSGLGLLNHILERQAARVPGSDRPGALTCPGVWSRCSYQAYQALSTRNNIFWLVHGQDPRPCRRESQTPWGKLAIRLFRQRFAYSGRFL